MTHANRCGWHHRVGQEQGRASGGLGFPREAGTDPMRKQLLRVTCPLRVTLGSAQTSGDWRQHGGVGSGSGSRHVTEPTHQHHHQVALPFIKHFNQRGALKGPSD